MASDDVGWPMDAAARCGGDEFWRPSTLGPPARIRDADERADPRPNAGVVRVSDPFVREP
jgi:hypothetical protein